MSPRVGDVGHASCPAEVKVRGNSVASAVRVGFRCDDRASRARCLTGHGDRGAPQTLLVRRQHSDGRGRGAAWGGGEQGPPGGRGRRLLGSAPWSALETSPACRPLALKCPCSLPFLRRGQESHAGAFGVALAPCLLALSEAGHGWTWDSLSCERSTDEQLGDHAAGESPPRSGAAGDSAPEECH